MSVGLAQARPNNIDISSKVRSTTKLGKNSISPSPVLQTFFFVAENCLYHLRLLPHQSSFSQSVLLFMIAC